MAALSYEVIDENIVLLRFRFEGEPLKSFVVNDLREKASAGGNWRVELEESRARISWDALTVEFSSVRVEEGYTVIVHPLEANDRVYGLGEKYGLSVDRRYGRYHIWNAPQSCHLPSGDPMYVSVPFIMVARPGKAYGLYVDYPGHVYVDAGVRDPGSLELRVGSTSFDLYVVAGKAVAEVLEAYSRLTGKPFLPPKWALGYHQSRYSYESHGEVLEVARRFRELGIPCDAIYLDIDYMEGYRVFTWDKERFPDPGGLAAELRRLGFRLVTIIDVGVKAEGGYHAFEEGLRRGAFTVDREGGLFKGGVWPGYCVFPDFYNSRARGYWSSLVARHLETGVDGIWLDMNEPEIFYMERPLEDLIGRLCDLNSRGYSEEAGRLLYEEGLSRIWTGGRKDRGPQDIGAVHVLDDGSRVEHDRVHNAYPLLEAMATREGFERARRGRRWFILSRSGFAGIQRYSAVWTGDNESDWGHMAASIPMILNLGLSGIPFAGADVGGFKDDVDPEMLVRWTQLGSFYPLFRNHSSKGTRRQEPWVFGEPYTSLVSEAIKLRYSLLPYIYYLFVEAHRRGIPVARPLFLEFPGDEGSYGVSDELVLGSSLLVAPVTLPGARARAVYLPEVDWLGFWDKRVYSSGWRLAEAPLDRIPLFVREDHGVVLTEPKQRATDPWDPLRVLVFLKEGAEVALYDDDGESMDYREGRYYEARLSIYYDRGRVEVESRPLSTGYTPGFREIIIELYTPHRVEGVTVDGEARRFKSDRVGGLTYVRVEGLKPPGKG